jgi:hypothetical protein
MPITLSISTSILVPIRIEFVVFAGVVLTLISAVIGLVREITRNRTEIRQKNEELRLQRKRADAERIRSAMLKTECHGKVICAEVLCLLESETYGEAFASLDALDQALNTLPENANPPIQWLHKTFADIFEGRILGSMDPISEIYKKTVECYTRMLPFVPVAALATDDYVRWLKLPGPGSHTIKLLAPLLRRDPSNLSLYNAYKNLLKSDSLPQLLVVFNDFGSLAGVLNADRSLDLIRTSLPTAAKRWEGIGTFWFTAALNSVGKIRNPNDDVKEELRKLASELATYNRGDWIYESAGTVQYNAFNTILAMIESTIGTPRGPRPQNRNVVKPANPGVEAEINSRQTGVSIIGKLGNFCPGGAGWKAGAWVTSNNGSWPRDPGEPWKEGSLTLHGSKSHTIVISSVQVKEPADEKGHNNPYGHEHGYRIKMPSLTPEERSKLEDLAKIFPLTR